jgi:DNA-binding NarL/FixJ family response regulator
MSEIRLAIVEDDPLVRENLEIFFEQPPETEVAFSAGSLEDFLELADIHQNVNTVLLDIGLPGMSGLQGIRPIRQHYPKADIIILSAYEDSDKVFKALCAGAVSYLTKRSDLATIKEAVRIVHRGGSYMSPGIARKVIDHFAPKEKNKDQALTPRQEQIVQGLVDGLSYKMIADKYLISVETVRDHIKKIYKKLQVNSKAEVIRIKLEGKI